MDEVLRGKDTSSERVIRTRVATSAEDLGLAKVEIVEYREEAEKERIIHECRDDSWPFQQEHSYSVPLRWGRQNGIYVEPNDTPVGGVKNS